MALEQKFVPAANWATQPFLGKQIVVIDENNQMGFWSGTRYADAGTSVYLGVVADQAAMLLLTGTAGQYIKRTDTGTNWQLDSDTDADDTGGERLARWRNLGASPTVSLAAANVTVADSGNKWVGADAETVLGEAGTRIAALENPPLDADLWDYLMGESYSQSPTPFGLVGVRAFADATLSSVMMTWTAYTANASSSAPAFADTNARTRRPRIEYVSATTVDGIAGLRASIAGYVNTTANQGGIHLRMLCGAGDAAAVANAWCIYGLRVSGSDTAGNIDLTADTNNIYFGAARGDAYLSLRHNDGAGATQVITLTDGPGGVGGSALNWPAHDPSELYLAGFTCLPGSRDWTVTLKRISTGAVYTRTLTVAGGAELPVNGTVMVPHICRGNGSTALAVTTVACYVARGVLDIPTIVSLAGAGGGGIDLANPNPFTVTQGVTAVNLGNITGTVTLTPRSQSNTMYAVLTGNVTFAVPTGGRSGDKLTLYLKQDATGGRTITMNASIKPLVGGATLLASTLPSTVDVLLLEYVDHDAGWRYSFINGTV